MSTLDLVPPPADDVVTFTVGKRRFAVTMAVTAAVCWLVLRGVQAGISAALGRPPDTGDLLVAAVTTLLYAAVFTGTLLALSHRRLAWVRTSAAGLEFAATGRDPVFLPWAAVASVRQRFRGPFAELDVRPTGMAAAGVARLGGRRPRVRRFGGPGFLVDVGLLRPGPGELMAEINRRLAVRA